jgi:hypothetical protein
MQKLQCPPGTEISGEGILSLVQNVRASEIQPILKKHNLGELNHTTWYPAQAYLDVLTDIRSSFYMNLVAVGMAVGENTTLPPQLHDASLGDILGSVDAHYQMHHRGTIGHAITEKVSDNHYKVTIHKGWLYPDDLEYGVLYGFAKRFLPRGTNFVVSYDPDVKRIDDGGDRTVIHIKW